MNAYQPVLNVYLIWHPDADARCRPLAEAVYTCLNRDSENPFARGIGIPVYFRCVNAPGRETPMAIDLDAAVHSAIFVLAASSVCLVLEVAALSSIWCLR